MSETSNLIEELTRLTPEEIYGRESDAPMEAEMEEMFRRDREFERGRSYDAAF